MLREEDCKPGAEIIAIKNLPTPGYDRPLLSIGMVYTVHMFSSYVVLDGKDQFISCISLNEIPKKHISLCWAYTLDQFKLRDREEFTELFKTTDTDLAIFVDPEEQIFELEEKELV